MLTQPLETLGLIMATYGGQNLGANKIGRIFAGLRVSCIIGAAYCAIVLIFVYFTSDYLSLLFIDASETAIIFQNYLCVFLLCNIHKISSMFFL